MLDLHSHSPKLARLPQAKEKLRGVRFRDGEIHGHGGHSCGARNLFGAKAHGSADISPDGIRMLGCCAGSGCQGCEDPRLPFAVAGTADRPGLVTQHGRAGAVECGEHERRARLSRTSRSEQVLPRGGIEAIRRRAEAIGDAALSICTPDEPADGCELHQTTPWRSEEDFAIPHMLGRAILHRGRHRHGAHPVTSGERYNLILWCSSSRFANQYDSQACPAWCGWQANP